MRVLLVLILLVSSSVLSEKTNPQKRNTDNQASESKHNPANPPNTAIGECLNCFDIQAPHAETEKHDTYDARADALYRWYLRATIIGVCGGLIGLVFLILQTVATHTAADAAKQSADAAQKSANVLIASQQPHIAANPNGNPGQDFCDPKGQHIRIDIYNTGLTPAFDCVIETWLEIFEHEFVDFTPNAEYTKRPSRLSLRPDDKPVTINIPIEQKLSPERVRAIKHHDELLCFRVLITYRDSFTPSRYANFGYILYGNGLGFLPKYNDSN